MDEKKKDASGNVAVPRVSVVLPCYNAEIHLEACLDSLLAQTYRDFEVIAIDDGSEDGTGGVISSYASMDPRIRPIDNDSNFGLVRTLNRGIGLARGEYIARIDADDVAEPSRFAKQVAYLDAHPGVDLVSSSVLLIDDVGCKVGIVEARSTCPSSCRFVALFATPVIHPALMGRKSIFRAFLFSLEPKALHTEDYELFSRMAHAGCRLANLPEPLLSYRVSGRSVSRTHEELQVRNFVSCVADHLRAGFHEDVPRPVVEVLANRIDFSRRDTPLRQGLALLDRLSREALREAEADPGAQREISAAACIQVMDILVQCLRKGRTALRVRAFAAALARWPAWLRGQPRRHLLAKFRRARPSLADAS